MLENNILDNCYIVAKMNVVWIQTNKDARNGASLLVKEWLQMSPVRKASPQRGRKPLAQGRATKRERHPGYGKYPERAPLEGAKANTNTSAFALTERTPCGLFYPGCRFALWLTLPWAGGLLPRWGVTLCMSNRPASKSPRLSPPWCITDLQIYNCLN